MDWSTCSPGQYVLANGAPGGDRICGACPSGRFSTVSNAASCTPWSTCEAGERELSPGSDVNDRTCLACPPGTYTSGPNQTMCVSAGDCLPGMVQTVAGTPTSPAVCTACTAGQHCAGAANPAVECGAGNWDHDADPATACALRTSCVAGTFVSSAGDATHDRVCAPCATGLYSGTPNAVACTPWSVCSPGTFVSSDGDATHNRTCSSCMTGSFSTSTNAAECTEWVQCGSGTYMSASGTATVDRTCLDCPLGSYNATGTNVSMCTPWQVCGIDYAEEWPGTSWRDRTCTPTGWSAQFGTDGADEALTVSANGSFISVGGRVDGVLPQQTDSGGWDAFVQLYLSNGTLLWTQQFGTQSNDGVVGVSVGPDNSVLVTGHLGNSSFLRKYAANGSVLWTQNLAWNTNGVSVGSDDSVVVVGLVTFALPGQSALGSIDAVVQKYTSAGALVWTRQFGTTMPDGALAVGVGANGDIAVAGYTYSALPGQTHQGTMDAFIRTYDTDGTSLWTRQIGTSSNEEANAVSVGADGSVVVAGYTVGTLPGQTTLGSVDAFVQKYDGDDGALVWTRQFGGISNDVVTGVRVGSDERVLLAGFTDAALASQTNLGGRDAFLVTYSASGGRLRTRQFGTSAPDTAFAVGVLGDGSAVVAGRVTYALPGQVTLGGVDAFLRLFVDP
jgi:hypothetical protein